MAKEKKVGLGALIARALGQDVGGGAQRPRKFDRSEWELQDDGNMVNVKTGEVRASLDDLETDATSATLDQSLSVSGKAEPKQAQTDEWDACQDLPAGTDAGERSSFDEYSQVNERIKREDAGDKVRVTKMAVPGMKQRTQADRKPVPAKKK